MAIILPHNEIPIRNIMNSIIEIENLSKLFHGKPAVDGLSLAVPEGTVTAFLGPNGAGKTTTIKCMLNLLEHDIGKVRVLGCEASELGPEQFQHIGYVSENQEMPLWMTVKQLLDYCRPMYPNWDASFEAKLLQDFSLPLTQKLSSLSRGQRMKASLLSSLAYRPKLVVLDEPFSGLDPLVRDEFLHGLLELTETEGWTVFISSHDIEEVERLADRVCLLNQGRLALEDTTESLQQRFRQVDLMLKEEVSRLPGNMPDSWLSLEQNGRAIRFVETAYDADQELDLIQTHFPNIDRHRCEPMKLREIFIALAKTYRLSAPQPNA